MTLLMPGTGLASTPRCAEFALPFAGDDALGELRAAGSFVVWSDGARLLGIDLRAGTPFVIFRKAGAYDVSGHTVALLMPSVLPADSPTTQRILLYDLRTKTAYTKAVLPPAEISEPLLVGPPRLAGGLLVFTVRDAETGLNRVFAVTYDSAARTVGTPFAVSGGGAVAPDVSAGAVVWWQANLDSGVRAALVDVAAAPPLVSSLTLSSPEPVSDAVCPAVSGDLVVWDDAADGPPRVMASRLDRDHGTASPPVTLTADGHAGSQPDVDEGLVVFTANAPKGESSRVYGVLVDTTTAAPAPGEIFLVGGAGAGAACVSDGLVTWLQFRDGAYRPRAALVDPSRPTSSVLSATGVRSGGQARIRYRVRDRLWKVRVTVIVKTKSGRVVQVSRQGWRRANKSMTARFTCRLSPGTYQVSVGAVSMTGLKVSTAGARPLAVRP